MQAVDGEPLRPNGEKVRVNRMLHSFDADRRTTRCRPRELQILETELRALVGGRGGVDHTVRAAASKGSRRTVDEHEIGHVVEGKVRSSPFGG
jgi:hypothetical protein